MIYEFGIWQTENVRHSKRMIKKMTSVAVAALWAVFWNVSANAADVYKVDALHSNVLAKVSYYEHARFTVRFNEFEGSITVDESDPSKGAVNFVVKAGSVDSGNPGRDEHLRGPDFFNAAEFPEFRFESTSVTPTSSPDEYIVNGNLTVLGKTRPAQARFFFLGKGKGRRGEERAGGEAVLTFKRSDFGMSHDIPALGDEVTVTVSVTGVKQ